MFGPKFAQRVAEEINKARTDPESYAKKINDSIQYFYKNLLRLPHESGIETQEGPKGYKEAAEFLSKAQKLPALKIEPKLTEAAQEIAKEMGKFKEMDEMDGVDREAIIKKYGYYKGKMRESTDFGSVKPELVVCSLLVDDGNESRSNRELIFNPEFTVVGTACQPHDDLGAINLIIFASNFTEGEEPPMQPEVVTVEEEKK